MVSGQIATSAEVTPNGGLVRESPQNPLNSGLGIILICPEWYGTLPKKPNSWTLPLHRGRCWKIDDSGFSLVFVTARDPENGPLVDYWPWSFCRLVNEPSQPVNLPAPQKLGFDKALRYFLGGTLGGGRLTSHDWCLSQTHQKTIRRGARHAIFVGQMYTLGKA